MWLTVMLIFLWHTHGLSEVHLMVHTYDSCVRRIASSGIHLLAYKVIFPTWFEHLDDSSTCWDWLPLAANAFYWQPSFWQLMCFIGNHLWLKVYLLLDSIYCWCFITFLHQKLSVRFVSYNDNLSLCMAQALVRQDHSKHTRTPMLSNRHPDTSTLCKIYNPHLNRLWMGTFDEGKQ